MSTARALFAPIAVIFAASVRTKDGFPFADPPPENIPLSFSQTSFGPNSVCSGISCTNIDTNGTFISANQARCCLEFCEQLGVRSSRLSELPQMYKLEIQKLEYEFQRRFGKSHELRLRPVALVGYVNGAPITHCQKIITRETTIGSNLSQADQVIRLNLDHVAKYLSLFPDSTVPLKNSWRVMKFDAFMRRSYLAVGTCLPVDVEMPEGTPAEVKALFARFQSNFMIWKSVLSGGSPGELIALFHLLLCSLYLELLSFFDKQFVKKLPRSDLTANPELQFEIFLTSTFTPAITPKEIYRHSKIHEGMQLSREVRVAVS